MKFTIVQSDLVDPLTSLVGVVPGTQTVSTMSDILIEPSSEGIRFTATDNSIRLAFNVAVKGEDLKPCTLPARKLLGVCSRFPASAAIDFEHDAEQKRMQFTCGSSSYELVTRDPDAFPGIESSEEECSIDIPEALLLGLLTPVRYAASQNDMRYYLMGVLLDVAPDNIAAAATDGHRLAMREESRNTSLTEPRQLILPNKSVEKLTGLLKANTDDNVTLHLAGNHLKVEMTGYREGLDTILVEGKYPDYRAVVPTDREIHVKMVREDLQRATERLQEVSDDDIKGVKISLTDDGIEINCHNNVGDTGKEVFAAEHSGSGTTVSLNVTYLMDALANMMAEEVALWFKDESHSVLLTSEVEGEGKHIIMPMRT